jgi:hypothetical protein
MRNGHALEIEEFEGGYKPPPIPPGYVPPPRVAVATQIVETTDGEWNQPGTWGRQVEYQFPASLAADPIPVFSLDHQPGPPRPRTLNLFRSDGTLQTDFPIIDNAEIYARITYGVSGILNQFLCDWTRGGQLCLVCQTLRLEAVAYAPSSLAIYSPPPGKQLIGAMIGQTGAPPTLPPTFTTPLTHLLTANQALFVVPDFARKLFVIFNDQPIPANVLLTFFTPGEQVAIGQHLLTETTAIEGLIIPGGTAIVEITNTSGVFVNFVCVFQLGL